MYGILKPSIVSAIPTVTVAARPNDAKKSIKPLGVPIASGRPVGVQGGGSEPRLGPIESRLLEIRSASESFKTLTEPPLERTTVPMVSLHDIHVHPVGPFSPFHQLVEESLAPGEVMPEEIDLKNFAKKNREFIFPRFVLKLIEGKCSCEIDNDVQSFLTGYIDGQLASGNSDLVSAASTVARFRIENKKQSAANRERSLSEAPLSQPHFPIRPFGP